MGEEECLQIGFDPFNCDMNKEEENYFICYNCVRRFIKDIRK